MNTELFQLCYQWFGLDAQLERLLHHLRRYENRAYVTEPVTFINVPFPYS